MVKPLPDGYQVPSATEESPGEFPDYLISAKVLDDACETLERIRDLAPSSYFAPEQAIQEATAVLIWLLEDAGASRAGDLFHEIELIALRRMARSFESNRLRQPEGQK